VLKFTFTFFTFATIAYTGFWYAESQTHAQNPASQHFKWPAGKHAAISLSFDDARKQK
jgi:hypothetical protein